MAKRKIIDLHRAIELYNKFGSLNRTALSLDCSPTTLKKLLIDNGIELKKYKPAKLNMKYSNKCLN